MRLSQNKPYCQPERLPDAGRESKVISIVLAYISTSLNVTNFTFEPASFLF